MPRRLPCRRTLLLLAVLWLVSAPALAQQGFEVLLDTDNDPLTGCTVATPDGDFTGAEHRLSVAVSADALQIDALGLQTCSGGVFGAPQALPGPPIPTGSLEDNVSLLEFALAQAALGDPRMVRFGVIGLFQGVPVDALLSADGSPGGAPMVLVLRTPAIPLLGGAGLVALGVLLVAGLWLARGRSRRLRMLLAGGLASSVLWAIELDGDGSDWAGIDPLGTDPSDETVPDLRAFFATVHEGSLVMRIDAVLLGPPTATVTTPGAPEHISTEPVFSVAFSGPVDVSDATAPDAFELDCGAGPVNLVVNPALPAAGTEQFTAEASGLDEGAECTFTIHAERVSANGAGMLENVVETFTVDTAPSVTGTTPAEGATVALDATFTFQFSEPVTPDSANWTLECPASSARTFTLNQDGGEDTVTLVPDSMLESGAGGCFITIASNGVSDVDSGDPPDGLAAPFTLNFAVDAAPGVIDVVPADGALAEIDTSLQVTFSEPVDVSGDWIELACTTSGTMTPAAGLTVSGGPEVFTATPDSNLALNEDCTATVFAGLVSDQDDIDPPDHPLADFTWSFTIPAVALDDSYMATPHLTLAIGTAGPQDGGVLANDSAGVTVTGYGGGTCNDAIPGNATATTLGGSVTVAADGSFSYAPPAGVRNTDDGFCYTITGGATAMVSLALENTALVWFYQQGAAGTGTQAAPFGDLAGNVGATTAGDTLHLADGAYTCGITLANSQRIVGGASSQSLQQVSGVTPVAGSTFPVLSGNSPGMSAANANCITLAQNNVLRGFGIGDTGTGTGLSGANFAALTTSEFTIAGTGRALNLDTGTLAATFTALSSTTSGNEAVRLVGVGGNLGAPAGALGGAAGAAFLIDGGDATVSFGGTIANTAGRSVVVQNRTGGSATFGGAITDSGTGILINSNSAGTTRFQGGMSLVTGANPAFTATGGGTVEVCDENPCDPTATGGMVNTLTTTTGTALNVANTTIGANNLEFRSISSNGAANAIVLNNTGASGALVVKGSGAAGSGGTIQNGTIGLSLTGTQNASFSWMQFNDFGDFAIRGSAVTGFTLADSVISGVNGDNAAADEGSIRFTELTGSATVSNTSISGGFEDNFKLVNTSGTLDRLTFSNVTIGSNSVADGNDGIGIEAAGSAVVNVTVQDSTFTAARGDLFQMSVPGSGGGDLVFTGNTLSNTHPGIATGGGGVTLGSGSTSIFTLNIDNNTFRDAVGHAVLIVKDVGPGSLTGSFTNNQIGVAALADSGSLEGDGLKIQQAGQGTLTMTVTNNLVSQYNNQGIHLQAGAGIAHDGNFNVTVSGNIIASPGSNPNVGLITQGLHLNNGVTPGDTFQTCVDIGPNTITNSGRNGGTDFRLRARQSTTVRLPGYAGGTHDTAAVVTFVQSKLVAAASGSAAADAGSGGFVGFGIVCP